MKKSLTILLALMLITTALFAQKDTVVVNGLYTGGAEGSLNDAVDEVRAEGKISETVFKLHPYGYYVLNGTIVVDSTEHLTIVAPKPGTTQEEAPPQIVWTTSESVDKEYSFQCYGDITLKNIWLRYADADGNQLGSEISMEDQSEGHERGTFEGMIFDFGPLPSSVRLRCDNFIGEFKNCYFRNNCDPHYRYYGRALAFPYNSSGWHTDSVLFENCTFANMGYVYMQEGAEYGDNVHFNHCTFLNIAMHCLESGWWKNMYVTNSLVVNSWMYGYIPAQVGDGEPNGAIFPIEPTDSIDFETPFESDQDRNILCANVSHCYQDWLLDWMENNPYSQNLHQNRRDDEIPQPQPMFNETTLNFFDSTDAEGNEAYPTISSDNLYEGVDPEFVEPPTNYDALKTWLRKKWDDNSDTLWAYNLESGENQTWPLPEDLSYTNETLKTAAMGGFPLGDLYNWWPEKYEEWKAQKDSEYDRIHTWLETGTDPNVGIEEQVSNLTASEFKLKQNYPNPFNPTTKIEYYVPNTDQFSLKVYNNLGQEIATLYEGSKPVGNYTATFNGRKLASGIYFYRLESKTTSITKKLILLK